MTFQVLMSHDHKYFTAIYYSPSQGVVGVDTSRSCSQPFSVAYADRYTAPLRMAPGTTIRLHILVDASSVEMFVNQGHPVFSVRVFPPEDATEFAVQGGDNPCKLQVYNLASIW